MIKLGGKDMKELAKYITEAKVLLQDKDLLKESAFACWLKLNKKCIQINEEINGYLTRKREEFAYLSNIDINKMNETELISLKTAYSPQNNAYLKELFGLATKVKTIMAEMMHPDDAFQLSGLSKIKDAADAQASVAHDKVVNSLMEVDYLEPLVIDLISRVEQKEAELAAK